MDITKCPGSLLEPYKLFSADSGIIAFKIDCRSYTEKIMKIILMAKKCPHDNVITIIFGHGMHVVIQSEDSNKTYKLPFEFAPGLSGLILSWFNNSLCFGNLNDKKLYKLETIHKNTLIGYVSFHLPAPAKLIIENPEIPLKPLSYKHVQGGALHWVSYNRLHGEQPPNAFIGGFEDGESIYIACASHHRSQCPGKYVPSKGHAFVPWGHLEHRKEEFEILCGYDGMWVKCTADCVPENAFVAGMSEVNNENLYVGRAMINSDLIVGKVHMLYKTCYLPYKGVEVECYSYEILVRGNVKELAESCRSKCSMNPLKSLQLCI